MIAAGLAKEPPVQATADEDAGNQQCRAFGGGHEPYTPISSTMNQITSAITNPHVSPTTIRGMALTSHQTRSHVPSRCRLVPSRARLIRLS